MREYGYIRVAAATPHVRVASVRYNAQRIEQMMLSAHDQGVELVLFPELSITGYTCADLLLSSQLLTSAKEALLKLVDRTRELECAAVVGMPLEYLGKLYNCAVVLCKGDIVGAVPKTHIPNYSEFYEARWFASGANIRSQSISIGDFVVPFGVNQIFEIDGARFAIEICEDLWVAAPPSSTLCQVAHLILNPSASPDVVGKYDYLTTLVSQQSARTIGGYLYCSAGFGESSTDLVFSGKGLIYENGRELASSALLSLDEQLTVADIDIELLEGQRVKSSTFRGGDAQAYVINKIDVERQPYAELARSVDSMPFVPQVAAKRDARCEEIFAIQTSGLAQRLSFTGCRSVVIGISGGLDSTLALLVAVRTFDRLGLDRAGIVGVTMPGFGTTDRTYYNAVNLINELGVTLREISIKDACLQHFQDIGLSADDRSVSYENSQARERTQILMDISNMVGGMVIGTGDLSELALGWATYNGDHMSMYGVNCSVPKTLIRYLVGWVAECEENRDVQRLLLDVIDTPVSPELLPADENGDIAQKTEDLVGPYELHDFFLYNFVRLGYGARKILFLAENAFVGRYSKEIILKWLRIFMRRFFAQQFKRSAIPDGPKVGSVTLSPRGDWRMPSDASAEMWLAELD